VCSGVLCLSTLILALSPIDTSVFVLMFYSLSMWLCCKLCFFFKQKTAYEMCGRDWSSDVCSSDLVVVSSERPSSKNGRMGVISS